MMSVFVSVEIQAHQENRGYLFTSLAGIISVVSAPAIRHADTRYIPICKDPVVCFIHPSKYGDTKPERPPTELITAIPAAAPVPAKKAVGKLQNKG